MLDTAWSVGMSVVTSSGRRKPDLKMRQSTMRGIMKFSAHIRYYIVYRRLLPPRSGPLAQVGCSDGWSAEASERGTSLSMSK
jgi:hypothetical protein